MREPILLPRLGAADFPLERGGSKATRLHELRRAGFRVPPGFVVEQELDIGALDDAILTAAVSAVGGFPVAVRSSGILEDLPDASFAGLYETVLGVSSAAGVRAAIETCRRSASSERARVYTERVGLDARAGRMAVLVQRMVDARIAGVAFSIHPISGREEHGYVECCAGLGEELVSGRVTPSRYTIELETARIVEEHLGSDEARLSPGEARTLSSALLEVQAFGRRPQDIEWAVDQAGVFWLLQARPITQVRSRADIEEFTNADLKDGGISANSCTPHMFSLYHRAFQRSMQAQAEDLGLIDRGRREQWIAHYYGRGYWNASAVKRLLTKVPGFDEEKFDRDLGIQKDYGDAGPLRTPTNIGTVLPALPIALALARSYRVQLEEVARFSRVAPAELAAEGERSLRVGSLRDDVFFPELEEIYFGLHARTEEAYFTTIYCNSNAQTDFKSLLATMDAATGRSTKLIDLMSGLSGVHHMEMQRGICRLVKVAIADGLDSSSFAVALDRFIADHGFHADSELDITVPRWSERPARVREHVSAMLRTGASPADPDVTEREQRQRFEAEKGAIEALLAGRLLWRVQFLGRFRTQLRRARAFLSSREQMRKYSTQVYGVVRAYSLEAGRRLRRLGKLDAPSSVFMLWIEEVVDLWRGQLSSPEAARRVAFRRLMHEGYRDFTPPNEIGRGVAVRGARRHVRSDNGQTVLVGLGCSPGIVEGPARVIRSLDELHELRKGDILVTKFTDPAWTPALGLVAGVVTEVGGLLSHAAVIGREYGLPAVLDLAGATTTLRSGQRIRVDGSNGTVEVLEA